MANSETRTSTSNTLGEEHQVFLSFRGPDTRRGFTNSLYYALVGVGIRVFIDDEELRPGDRISDNLLRAIDDSKLYIPIFSKNYASSHWCLRELTRMVENTSECKEDGKKKVVLPIFYDVEPNDVKLETKLYTDAISNLEQKKFSFEDIKKWRWALKEVGCIKGWELKKYSGDGELTKLVVHEVLDKLGTRQRTVTENLVGMEDHITAIKNLLNIGSDGVRLIGIYGMGGIGKTTLAKIIFNQLCPHFGKNCSFLDDMRETTKTKGLVELQKKLLSNISPARVDVDNIDSGIKMIRETIYNKDVLIVLDDVNHEEQIRYLIGGNSLYPGSTILVTTRDKSVLNIKEFKFKGYEMVPLSDEDALKLFCRHAFNDNSPPTNYNTLTKSIVSTTSGLPLALQVIGASLNGEENEIIWEERLKMLGETPDEDVLGKLRISYDALKPNQQKIFLDVAFCLVGEEKTSAMYVWEACKLFPEHDIQVLTKRCMIKVLNGRLTMHDQLRDLGRTIAKEEGSRLCIEDDIICELRSIKNKLDVQALDLRSSGAVIGVTPEQIKCFPYLRFLRLINVICQGDFTGCLSELRWIGCYATIMPKLAHRRNQCLEATNLRLENAVVVNLHVLDITENAFESLIKGTRKLKVLTINSNTSLHEIPTFPKYSVLKKLTTHDFWSLMEIDCSIGQLRCLTKLRIENCYKLMQLPEQIGELLNLQHLSLRLCINLIELPDSVLKLKSLMKLDVSLTKITRLPDSIGRLSSLSFADVTFTQIEKLPSTMSKFRQLKTLNLRLCDRIQELPKLPRSLTTLQVTSTSLLTVPNLSYLSELVELYLSDGSEHRRRSDIIQTCDLGWIGKLSKLSKLRFCFPSVCASTIVLGSLSQLKELTLHGLDLPTFEQLPSNLIVLKLYETREKQEHLDGLPPLRKSRENKVCEQHDVQFPDVLESSERSSIRDCRSSERLVCQPEEPRCNEQQAPELIDHQREAFLFPSSLNMLIECCLSGFPEVQDIRFVSPLESLEEFSVKECSSLKSLGGLSSSKNLKRLEIDQCPSLKVVEGIDELEFLRWLEIGGCRSLERIFDASRSKVRKSSKSMVCHPEERGKSELQAPELTDHWREAILFPSSQKMLRRFSLSGSHEVQDIQFDSTFKSLEEISVCECSSLKRIGGLSNLKNLKWLNIDQCSSLKRLGSLSNLKNLRIKIDQCPSLQVIEGIYELKSSCSLNISGCIFEMIFDVLSSKEPDNCEILIPGEKLSDDSELGYTEYFDTWESYREKILSRTKQAPGSEIETTNSETETGDPLQKTNQENKEKKRKRKTESAKQQGRRKRRKLQQKAWVRLFHPIISLCRTRKINRRRERARRSAKEQGKRKRGKSA